MKALKRAVNAMLFVAGMALVGVGMDDHSSAIGATGAGIVFVALAWTCSELEGA